EGRLHRRQGGDGYLGVEPGLPGPKRLRDLPARPDRRRPRGLPAGGRPEPRRARTTGRHRHRRQLARRALPTAATTDERVEPVLPADRTGADPRCRELGEERALQRRLVGQPRRAAVTVAAPPRRRTWLPRRALTRFLAGRLAIGVLMCVG